MPPRRPFGSPGTPPASPAGHTPPGESPGPDGGPPVLGTVVAPGPSWWARKTPEPVAARLARGDPIGHGSGLLIVCNATWGTPASRDHLIEGPAGGASGPVPPASSRLHRVAVLVLGTAGSSAGSAAAARDFSLHRLG